MATETHNPTWITVDTMRKRLAISRGKAYEIATSGAFETVKIGRALRINEQSFMDWLHSQRYQQS
jgi:excisionase family DNA binding protein